MSDYIIISTSEHPAAIGEIQKIAQILGPSVHLILRNQQELDLQIGKLDPDNLIIFSETLSKSSLEFVGDFDPLAYNIREVKLLGRNRRLLVLPEPQDCDSTKMERALLRLKEIL